MAPRRKMTVIKNGKTKVLYRTDKNGKKIYPSNKTTEERGNLNESVNEDIGVAAAKAMNEEGRKRGKNMTNSTKANSNSTADKTSTKRNSNSSKSDNESPLQKKISASR